VSTQVGLITINRFVNPSGMLAVGANVLRPTEASGPPIQNAPGTNGLGQLKQGFIERSNVQIVNELVNLIVAQRAYEVNSRAIQASDQMLSTATNLSR
jgi:flagellar basal-body rod protein FlgG